jgi:hypothetical protein
MPDQDAQTNTTTPEQALSYSALLATFAANAPEVPEWFKPFCEIKREPILDPNRAGWMKMADVEHREDPLDHLTRWRWSYAQAMVNSIPANSEH